MKVKSKVQKSMRAAAMHKVVAHNVFLRMIMKPECGNGKEKTKERNRTRPGYKIMLLAHCDVMKTMPLRLLLLV